LQTEKIQSKIGNLMKAFVTAAIFATASFTAAPVCAELNPIVQRCIKNRDGLTGAALLRDKGFEDQTTEDVLRDRGHTLSEAILITDIVYDKGRELTQSQIDSAASDICIRMNAGLLPLDHNTLLYQMGLWSLGAAMR
jgi:hypothetical protein